MNEELAIITSLNLYEFSQINNNEMGVLIRREEDGELYRETYDEAQRIIRISDEVRISLERVSADAKGEEEGKAEPEESGDKSGKLTTSKLAQKFGMKTGGVSGEACCCGTTGNAGWKALPDGQGEGGRRGVQDEFAFWAVFSLA